MARLYSKVAFRTALAVLFAACAGCWEKIEYTGPRTTAATPTAASPASSAATESPAAADSPPTAEPPVAPPVVSVAEPPAVVVEEPPAPPSVPETGVPVVTATPPPEVVGDRYATPPLAESPPSTAVAASTPPPTVAAPVAVPETTNPYAEAEPPSHSDATPVSATDDVSKPAVAINSRRAAWLLGSRLSLAALANDRGIAAKSVPIWMEDARTAAKLLGTSVADLPEPAGASDTTLASRQVIDYLVANGQRIGPELSKQYGAEQSALFEIALKSNILLLLYSPETSAGGSVAAAISQVAPKAKLPVELWQPLVEVLNKKATQSEVRAAIRKMHVDVDQYLSQLAEQSGR